MIVDEGCFERGCACHDSRESPGVVVIKREWRGLTVPEMVDLWRTATGDEFGGVERFARAIEAALKERNV
jgi:hypothetical protein